MSGQQLKRAGWLRCLVFAASLSGAVLAKAEDAPGLRVLVDDAHPPFSYRDQNDQAAGLSVQILQTVFTVLHRKVEIEAVPWRRAVVLAATTPNVLLASVMKLPERQSQFVWLGPLFHESISLYALKSRGLRPANAAALSGLHIGTPRDSAAHRQLLKLGIPLEQIDTVGDPIQNLRKLQAGRLDLITMQPAILAWHARHLGIAASDFEPVYPLLPRTAFHLAASPGTDPALVKQLKQTLNQLERDGTLTRLRAQAGL